MMDSLDYKFTPKQLLETEEVYPGLWGNVSIVLWQRRLLSEQEGS